MQYEHYGKRIKDLRVQRGMSQIEFAAAVGMHPPNISIYENGHKIPQHRVIVRIAIALGLDVAEELRIGGIHR